MTASVDPDPRLQQECSVFTRYLTGRSPTPYVLRTYRDGHQSLPSAGIQPFDRIALALCRRGVAGATLADAYTRWFRPASLVRLKLTLMLAILENTPPFHAAMTRCRTGARILLALQLVVLGVWYGITLVAAALLLGPLHLATSLGKRAGR
jgi:hypothetical protein